MDKLFNGAGNTLCSFIPCTQFKGLDVSKFDIKAWIAFGLSIVFVLMIIFAIFLIIRSVIKIIRSEGDEKQIQEGFTTIKGVWQAIGLLFIGIIGIVLVIAFFRASGILQTQVNPPINGIPFFN